MPSRHRHRNANGRGSSSSPTRFTMIAGIFALLLIVGAAIGQSAASNIAQAAGVQAPNVVSGTISPLVAHSRLLGPADSQQVLSLSIGLHPQHEAALNSYVQDIYRKGSVNSHRYLTPTQFAGVYAPSKKDYDAVTQFIQAGGFTITSTYTQHLLIGFTGTVGQAEQAFHVSINNYVAPDGHTFFANSGDPVLPGWTAGIVQGVNGLSNATSYQHQSLVGKGVAKLAKVKQNVAVACPTTAAGQLLPTQVATAYDLNGLYTAGYQGEGQTIALFELAGYVPGDLTAYTKCFGGSKVNIESDVVGAGPIPMDANVLKVETDAEMILSAAPQLANLKIYQSAQADYLNQWARIVSDAIPVVSTSWATCEQLTLPATITEENTLFTTAVAQGQTIFAAAGDTGSEGCFQKDPTITTPAVDDPASQPYVTGVGGTSLTTGAADAYVSEAAWNTATVGSGGGGMSQVWTKPTWQAGTGVVTVGGPCPTTPCRQVPDVSLNANPNNGYPVYCTANPACSSGPVWQIVGGTGAATSLWAAWMALTNEFSLQDEGFNLGFINPSLYPGTGLLAANFHDILAGSTNDYLNVPPVQYLTTTGYDMATGLGSYDGFALSSSLEDPTNRTHASSTQWYFAEGSVGGGFQEYLTLFNPSPYNVATVNIKYMFESRDPVIVNHVIAAGTRITVSVNDDLSVAVTDPQQAVSAAVYSINGLRDGIEPVVAERPMYFHYGSISSGTDTLGSTGLHASYYFPLVDSRQAGRTYKSFISLLNPSSSATATVTVTYFTGSCGRGVPPACPTQNVTIPPLRRMTVSPLSLTLQQQMSVRVTSTGAAVPIAVERSMYASDTIPTAGGLTTGAATVAGVTTPGNDWLFAEGYTGTNFQEYLVLANFSTSTIASASVKLEYANGTSQTVTVNVPALGQTFFDVNNAFNNPVSGCACTPTTTVSAEVTSGINPIVAERLMYFHQSSAAISGITEVIGQVAAAVAPVFSFAEGYTTNSFNEYLTMQNPNSASVTASVTVFVDGYVLQKQVVILGFTRYTLSVNALVGPIIKGHLNMGKDSYDVSLEVEALVPVVPTTARLLLVAERPMYFNYSGIQGGTDVIGLTPLG